ncbi:MAG: Spy/CpxP family protein refolding chaperone [Thiobacillaceae bacterium]
MKLIGNQFTYASARLIVAAALASTLAFAPGMALAADKDVHEDRAEMRIKDMHAQLRITPPEEAQWGKIADLMRDNAKTMDTLTQARMAHAKDMTAVDDLKSYGEIAQAHADGIKELTPLFADLYASMSDEQKKEADNLFRHGKHKRVGHKHGHTKPEGK